ncbi:hypothetical protein LEP3755_33740 [Leptolyngbya sp. NIES-3755]|nr:hypothetical protein LEP3755_33740 [Leptolyngbya sp. NIES-3755]
MKTKIELLLDTLADGKWHSSQELSEQIGWRFGNLLYQAKQQGYSIQTERDGLQYRYRRILKNSDVPSSAASDPELAIAPALQQVSHERFINFQSAVPQIVEQLPCLKMLVLFGSRARGEEREDSDWDFAVLHDLELRKQYEKKDGWGFKSWVVIQQVLQLPDDKIDIVDLDSCSDVMAHIIARDGQLLYERNQGDFANFRQNVLKSKAELRRLEQEEQSLLELELRQWGV